MQSPEQLSLKMSFVHIYKIMTIIKIHDTRLRTPYSGALRERLRSFLFYSGSRLFFRSRRAPAQAPAANKSEPISHSSYTKKLGLFEKKHKDLQICTSKCSLVNSTIDFQNKISLIMSSLRLVRSLFIQNRGDKAGVLMLLQGHVMIQSTPAPMTFYFSEAGFGFFFNFRSTPAQSQQIKAYFSSEACLLRDDLLQL